MSEPIPPADIEEQKVDPLIDDKAAEETDVDEDPVAPAAADVPVKENKTCVVPMGKTAPAEDGDYVMFAGDKYKVFEIKAGAGLPENVEPDAQFFKVVEKPMAGGRRKKQHKSAKKQRKSAKKQHKSAKKQRKSRSSRRSKK